MQSPSFSNLFGSNFVFERDNKLTAVYLNSNCLRYEAIKLYPPLQKAV